MWDFKYYFTRYYKVLPSFTEFYLFSKGNIELRFPFFEFWDFQSLKRFLPSFEPNPIKLITRYNKIETIVSIMFQDLVNNSNYRIKIQKTPRTAVPYGVFSIKVNWSENMNSIVFVSLILINAPNPRMPKFSFASLNKRWWIIKRAIHTNQHWFL